MKKIIIITGMTGSGKSKFSKNILNLIDSDIIVSDIQQFYYNFPIWSNQEKNLNFKYIGKFDCFNDKDRLNSNIFKELINKKITNIINNNKIPILEGGSYFYLNYLLTNQNNFDFDENIEKKAMDILELTNYNWEEINNLYKDFNYKLDINDKYRIKSYLINYLNNKKNIKNENPILFKDLYDIRGFCFYYDKQDYNKKLIDRALKMIIEGCIFEVYKYYKMDICKQKYNIPIGFTEIKNFLKKYNKDISFKNKSKLLRILIKEIVDATRKYAGNQLKYMKKYFNDFNWVKIEKNMNIEQIKSKIINLINLDKSNYELEVKDQINLNKITNEREFWKVLEDDIKNLYIDEEIWNTLFLKLDNLEL